MANKRRVNRGRSISKRGGNASIRGNVSRGKLSFNDYKKLGLEIWGLRGTKYVLGGIVLTSLMPVLMRAWRRNPQLGNFVSGKVDAVEGGFGKVTQKISDKISDIRGRSDTSEARH